MSVCAEFKEKGTRVEVQLLFEWRQTSLQIWAVKEKRGREHHFKIPTEEENH